MKRTYLWLVAGALAASVAGVGWHAATLQAGAPQGAGGPEIQVLPLIPAQAGSDAVRPVVVELFTSQGCSSCPPADRLLGELAGQPGVIALAHHVDYWDYIGWKDPFARPDATVRQRLYSQNLGLRFVYTPQIIIDGWMDVVGSRRTEVVQGVNTARSAAEHLVIEIDSSSTGTRVIIPAGDAPAEGATVWLAIFDDEQRTQIERGENSGRELIDSHVVREFVSLGTWEGAAMELPVDLASAIDQGRGGCAIIVQEGRAGRILGAAMMKLGGAPS